MSKNEISIKNPGKLIFQSHSFFTARLLRADEFIAYCKQRNVTIGRKRLENFEKLGLVKPLVRFTSKAPEDQYLAIPEESSSQWFEQGWLIDCHDECLVEYEIPEKSLRSSEEAYYSIFQLSQVRNAIESMQITVQLDWVLLAEQPGPDWNESAERWTKHARSYLDNAKKSSYEISLAALCQFISNRYYPHSQSNLRTIQISRTNCMDQWLTIRSPDNFWEDFRQKWNAHDAEQIFDLTPDKLEHIYRSLVSRAAFKDPLRDWVKLVQFVSVERKKKLKGDALYAQSLREAATMVRLLYKDLYNGELAPIDEVFGQVISPLPEREVQTNVSQYLRYVTNQYDLNPQPKLVLFLEGPTERILVDAIFEKWIGADPSKLGIEIVILGGVNQATGNKKHDRFTALLLLMDYLHHQQTLTFLILDNENNSEKLKAAAKQSKSLFGQPRLRVPSQHIKLWQVSVEFDNFSDTELAKALSKLSANHDFTQSEIKQARCQDNPNTAMARLFQTRTGVPLAKAKLATILSETIFDTTIRKNPKNRPIIKAMEQVTRLAALNPFPLRHDTWERNQTSQWLGGAKRPKGKAS